MLTVLLVAMFALSGWAIWNLLRDRRQVRLATVGMEYDSLVVSPLPFGNTTVAAIEGSNSFTRNDATGLRTAYQFSHINADLPIMKVGQNDNWLFYLQTHAFSSDGAAALACGDYFGGGAGRRTSSDGVVDVKEVLNGIVAKPTKIKLVFIDTGYLQHDVRGGVLANEFPALLERDLKAMPDDELWVLVAHDVLQPSGIDHGRRRTVFGAAVAEGLAGKANQPPWGNESDDGFVSLDELYRYVHARCVNWIPAKDGISQTPLLMKAGEGLVDMRKIGARVKAEPVKYKLVPVRGDDASDDEEGNSDGKSRLPTRSDLWRIRSATRPSAHDAVRAASALRSSTSDKTSESDKSSDDSTTAPAPAPADAASPPSAESPAESPADATTKEANSTPPAPGENGRNAEDSQTDERTRSTPRAAGKPAPDTSNDAPAGEGLKASVEYVERLSDAWSMRDRLLSRNNPRGWSPLDYAPHFWCETEARLLYYEQACRYRDDLGNLSRIDELLDELKELDDAMTADRECRTSSSASSMTRNLLSAWDRFLREAKASHDQVERQPVLRSVLRARRVYRDELHRARYFVDWHARASMTSGSRVPVHDALSDQLSALRRLRETLDALAEAPIDPSSGELASVEMLAGEIAGRGESIYQGIRSPGEPHDEAFTRDLKPIDHRVLDDALSTPLLKSEDRREMCYALFVPADEPTLRMTGAATSVSLRPSGAQLSQLRRRLALERQLIAVVDPRRAERMEFPGENSGDMATYAKLGNELRNFYRGLPTSVRAGMSDGQTGVAGADSLLDRLSVMDRRDVVAELNDYPLPRFVHEVRIEERIWLADAAPLYQAQLSPGPDLTIDVLATRRELLDRPDLISIDQEGSLLDVRPTWNDIAARDDGSFARRVNLRIQALRDRQEAARRSVKLTVSLVDRSHAVGKPADITVELPLPDMVDLRLVRADGFGGHFRDESPLAGRVGMEEQDGLYQLRPFPNRRTGYQMRLINRSGAGKNVEVSLYSIPRRPSAALPPGLISADVMRTVFNHRTGEVADDARLLAQSEPIALAADADEQPVKFILPKQPAADAGGATGQTPPPPPPEDVRSGLLCVIRDDKGASWVKWFELRPLEPREYFTIDAGYDARAARKIAVLRPMDLNGDGQPDLPPGAPVDVAWAYGGSRVPQGVPEASFRAENGAVPADRLLYLESAPGADPWIRINVDGYPRAFVFRRPADVRRPKYVATSQDAVEIEPWNDASNETSIAIATLKSNDGKEIFHFTDRTIVPEKPADGEVHRALAQGEAAVVRTSIEQVSREVRVQVQIDVRSPGFESISRDDRLNVTFESEQGTKPVDETFTSKRQMELAMLPLDDSGLLTFETKVTDFDVRMDSRVTDQRIRVRAQLQCPDLGNAEDQVNVVFDGSPPTITRASVTPSTIVQGKDFSVTADVREISGIEDVEFGIDADGDGELSDEEKVKVRLEQPQRIGEDWRVRFSVPGKDTQPGEHALLLRVIDRVGRASDFERQTVRVTAQVRMVRGRLLMMDSNNKPSSSSMVVTLKGPAYGPVKVSLDRNFYFVQKGLPDGLYTIEAEGTVFNSYVAVGKEENVKPWPVDEDRGSRTVTILLSRKP